MHIESLANFRGIKLIKLYFKGQTETNPNIHDQSVNFTEIKYRSRRFSIYFIFPLYINDLQSF